MKFLRPLLILLVLIIAPAARAIDGNLTHGPLRTVNVQGPVDIAVYLPPNYDPRRAKPYPLLIQLHGGNGSSANMTGMANILDDAILKGTIEPVVSVMPSAERSFYMDYKDGSQKWETFILSDLIPYMRANYNVVKGRQGTLITGISMGGMGSLRIAFKHPEMFQAVASQEPGIEPALSYDDIKVRDRFWRGDPIFEEKYGKPVDRAYWAANNPANIAKDNPERLVGLGIYLEVGDQDMFYLNHGTEFLHRVLFDAGISHEYRLVKGAEHVGPSIQPRVRDALGFLQRELNPPADWVNADVLMNRQQLDLLKRAAGMPVVPADPRRMHVR